MSEWHNVGGGEPISEICPLAVPGRLCCCNPSRQAACVVETNDCCISGMLRLHPWAGGRELSLCLECLDARICELPSCVLFLALDMSNQRSGVALIWPAPRQHGGDISRNLYKKVASYTGRRGGLLALICRERERERESMASPDLLFYRKIRSSPGTEQERGPGGPVTCWEARPAYRHAGRNLLSAQQEVAGSGLS